jgi:hypothetical protein
MIKSVIILHDQDSISTCLFYKIYLIIVFEITTVIGLLALGLQAKWANS